MSATRDMEMQNKGGDGSEGGDGEPILPVSNLLGNGEKTVQKAQIHSAVYVT